MYDREQMEALYMKGIEYDEELPYTNGWTEQMDAALMYAINHPAFNRNHMEPFCKFLAKQIYNDAYCPQNAYDGFLGIVSNVIGWEDDGSFTPKQKREMAKVLMWNYREVVVNQA